MPQSNVFKLQALLRCPAVSKREREGGSRVRTANPKTLRAEVRKLRSTQRTLHNALRLLFELLEEYSPIWYPKHHQDQAKAALKVHEATSKFIKQTVPVPVKTNR
jgi:hypothetical protein